MDMVIVLRLNCSFTILEGGRFLVDCLKVAGKDYISTKRESLDVGM